MFEKCRLINKSNFCVSDPNMLMRKIRFCTSELWKILCSFPFPRVEVKKGGFGNMLVVASVRIIRRTANDVGGLFPPSVCSRLVISLVFHPEQPPPPYSSTSSQFSCPSFDFASRCSPSFPTPLFLFLLLLCFLSLLTASPPPPNSLSLSLIHPRHSPTLLLFYLVEVETFAGIPGRRALSFCPCCSPEGNTIPPPLPPVGPGLEEPCRNWTIPLRPLSPSSSSLLNVCDQAQ